MQDFVFDLAFFLDSMLRPVRTKLIATKQEEEGNFSSLSYKCLKELVVPLN